MGDDWNIKAQVMKQLEQFTYLVYGHISKSSVNAVHVKLPHEMVGEDKKLISTSGVDLSRLPRTSCGDVLPISPVDLLDAGDQEADD